MLPSQLTEGQWIKITVEHTNKKAKTAIGFHVDYSQFSCFALHHKCDPDMGYGLQITDDRQFADELYNKYLGAPHVTITTGGPHKTTKTVQQGTPDDD